VIWQGKPSAKGLALHVFRIREVALYFGLVGAWRMWSDAAAGSSAKEAILAASWLVVPALLSIAVLSLLAFLFARAARYTITNQRVAMQFGVALPMTLNIPLSKIETAALKSYRDGSGDIPLRLSENKGSFILLWPHVRPWRLTAVEPMLRSVPDAASVAAKLAEALSGKPTPAALAHASHVAGDAIDAAAAAA
jgi:hypothetical protein